MLRLYYIDIHVSIKLLKIVLKKRKDKKNKHLTALQGKKITPSRVGLEIACIQNSKELHSLGLHLFFVFMLHFVHRNSYELLDLVGRDFSLLP